MKFKPSFFFSPDPGAGSGGAVAAQNTLANNPTGPKTGRLIGQVIYASNSPRTLQVQCDSSYKKWAVNLVLATTTTFSSGSPTVSPLGTLSKICPQATIVVDGKDTVKVIDFFMQRCMNAIMYGALPRRAYNKGASLQGVNDFAATESLSGTYAYGTTTQDLIANDQVLIDFEHPFLGNRGKSNSQLYLKNRSSCQFTFMFGDISNIQTDGVGATVTYSNTSVYINVTGIEDRQATQANGAFYFNEFVSRQTYSSAQNLTRFQMNAGNRITHFAMMTRNGDTYTSLADNVVTDLKVTTNGVNPFFTGNFRDYRNWNQAEFGVANDQLSSGLSGLTGFICLPFIKNSDALSGLDTSRDPGGVNTVEFYVSTAAASGLNNATYTNPVQVSILQGQLVPVAV